MFDILVNIQAVILKSLSVDGVCDIIYIITEEESSVEHTVIDTPASWPKEKWTDVCDLGDLRQITVEIRVVQHLFFIVVIDLIANPWK
jgi:hypothetical protein